MDNQNNKTNNISSEDRFVIHTLLNAISSNINVLLKIDSSSIVLSDEIKKTIKKLVNDLLIVLSNIEY